MSKRFGNVSKYVYFCNDPKRKPCLSRPEQVRVAPSSISPCSDLLFNSVENKGALYILLTIYSTNQQMSSYRNSISSLNKKYDTLMNFLVSFVVIRRKINHITKISKPSYRFDKIKKKQWIKRWSVLQKQFNTISYDYFANYMGDSLDIVPEDISHNIIETILNPVRYRSVYSDKNMFDLLFSINNASGCIKTPKTLLRRINGCYYDENYNQTAIDMSEWPSIILVKPTVDSSSGKKIRFFKRNDDGAYICLNDDGMILSENYLDLNYHNDFVIQERLEQSQFMSNLCRTSINTIRITTYRSCKDNRSHILSMIVRIGKNGSLVDNAHAGGLFCSVDKSGKLGNKLFDQNGVIYYELNGINYQNQDLYIPNMGQITAFACEVANRIPHLKLLAQDIMIDKDNNPILIEYNTSGFSSWLFQMTGFPAFGDFTQEIIDYCRNHKKEATRIYIGY